MQKRVTQNDIATKAGVHPSTVSLALRNHASIPKATREKIKEIAREAGYSPDPMLGALAAYRIQMRPRSFQGILAWLSNNLGDFRWQKNKEFMQYFAGARLQAEAHGFRLQKFDLQDPGMTPKRIRSILHRQNIRGILLCPQPLPAMELQFPWEEFSVVTFGQTLIAPTLHRAAQARYDEMLETMQRLWELGYRRVGFVFHKTHVQRVNHQFLAGYLVGAAIDNRFPAIPPFYQNEGSLEAFGQWIRDHRCDAIVSGDDDILKLLARVGLKAPDDIGVANFITSSPDGLIAGIYSNPLQLGEVAADVVVRLVQHGETGIPSLPQTVYLRGEWIAGKTVRKQKLKKNTSIP